MIYLECVQRLFITLFSQYSDGLVCFFEVFCEWMPTKVCVLPSGAVCNSADKPLSLASQAMLVAARAVPVPLGQVLLASRERGWREGSEPLKN